MTPREFRQEQDFDFDHFQELTSTGIKPNYVNIEMFAHEYHKAKLKLLGIAIVSGTAEHHCGNQITEKELFHDHCLKCGEYFSED